MKRPIKDRVVDFMAGKGFYIVLLLCVAALGVSGYYLFSNTGEADQTVAGPAKVTVSAVPTARPTAEPPATAAPGPVQTTAPTAQPTPRATQAPQTTGGETGTATASVFTWPVKGEVLRGYAVETLAYDETMGDWRAHDGIDIAAPAGTQVMAPAGGTVSDIYQDDLMGSTVVILHADGVMSTCSNLEEVPAVEIGDTVRTGDIIGSVGATAIAESAEASHLHLSMTRDGVSVDPLEYLPQR